MAVRDIPITEVPSGRTGSVTNGAALAAVLAAGIGCFAMGLIVFLVEIRVLSVPALYGPAGGVTGRTTLAVVVWLIAWAILHWRWRTHELEPRPVYGATLVLIALGLLGTFPPFWGLFGD